MTWTPPPTPFLAVDMIVRMMRPTEIGFEQIILVIERKFPPLGFAFPGGFVEIGESCETAASREIQEETGLIIKPGSWNLFGVYSDPERDPRGHIVSVAYEMIYHGSEKDALAGDDAKALKWVTIADLVHHQMINSHGEIAADVTGKFLFS